mgnify:FL=1
MNIRHLIIAIISLSALYAPAQELNCTVEVNSDQINGTNKSVFTTLQEAITEYMNTTKFSDAQIAANEKIECKLFLTAKEYTDGKVKGDLQIQSTRPVYNSTYNTTIINFKDTKIDFDYSEGDPLVFSLINMESQLTAILNYYAYLILALDFDTFSLKGGTPFYERLETIVQQAQSSGETGWKAFEDTKNRSAVLRAFFDPNAQGMRELLYNYHRLGLDEMALSPDKGRAKIVTSIDALTHIYDVSPMSVALSMFRDAKFDEMVNICTKGSQTERDHVAEVFTTLYPTEQDRIKKIKQGTNK